MTKLSVERILNKAVKLKQKGRTNEARELFEAVLTKYPGNLKAQRGLENLSKKETNTQSSDIAPTELDSLIDLYKRNQLEAVVSQAKNVLKYHPTAYEVWNILGVAQHGMGKISEACISFKKSIELNPNFVDAFNNLGASLMENNDLQEADAILQKALNLNPRYAGAHRNLGNVYRKLGRLDEASQAFKNAILINSEFIDAYMDLGSTLAEQQNLDDALIQYKKVVSLIPDHIMANACIGDLYLRMGMNNDAIAYYQTSAASSSPNPDLFASLGIAQYRAGDLKAAISSYEKAISMRPDHAEAYSNLGCCFGDLERFDEAIDSFDTAIFLTPDFAEAHNNKGKILQSVGKQIDALNSYKKAIDLRPNYKQALLNFANLSQMVRFNTADDSFESVFEVLIETKGIVRPSQISATVSSLIVCNPGFLRLERCLSGQDTQDSVVLTNIEMLSELTLLLKLMKVCPIADLRIEALLQKIRRNILFSLEIIPDKDSTWQVLSALACQCFLNEYIYLYSELERAEVTKLISKIRSKIDKGMQPESKQLLCLGAFERLDKYEWISKVQDTPAIHLVVNQQVYEPSKESEIKNTISILGDIRDSVSSKVRQQYEHNPYPKWIVTHLPLEPKSIAQIAADIPIRLANNAICDEKAPSVLIAGCGTGQHPITAKARYKNSSVLAVDISQTSLSYAQRKTLELGIEGIQYMQADILSLDHLDQSFDIIESAGVIHHMKDPYLGWRILTDRLKNGGLLRLGLYSEIARRSIVEIRNQILEKRVEPTVESMREFRHELINSLRGQHKDFVQSSDFFDMSSFRDLLFHVEEHRFNLSQIRDCLDSLGLRFCGFELPADEILMDFKSSYSDSNAPYNLDLWSKYETLNPTVFFGMYQFWCQKV